MAGATGVLRAALGSALGPATLALWVGGCCDTRRGLFDPAQCDVRPRVSKGSFSPDVFREYPVMAIIPLSNNARLFRMKLPASKDVMGLSVASCIHVQAEQGGAKTVRPYTPTTTNFTQGYFDLVVKRYPDGMMSSHFFGLNVGDKIQVKGPFPKIKYERNMAKRVGMVAGGTGITPMLQVLEHALADSEDNTEFSLIYCNISPEDILLKDRLDDLAERYHRFRVFYVVEKPEEDWEQGSGYVTLDMIERKLPAAEVIPPPIVSCIPTCHTGV
uniref:NADH-cytochrome b5 reductase n=1 Tax=Rhizochromulina marina TaxID=1034831 RepID=A0A7S2SKK2_9STRA|mmetsp:Transcript_31648/g.91968  ORF Transcript_31648/g.91968 Transcript_31648/m.91968 type:complete len:273 (+) Transcript_31648:106-924(+)